MQPIPAGASFSCHQPEMAHQQRRQLPRPHHPWPLMPMPPSSLVALQHAMSQWRNCCQLPPPLLLPPTPPAPLPLTLPQTPPLQNHSRLSANDQPSRPRHRHPDTNAKQPENSLLEACLEGRTVLAFNVGGEKRLCLPQVLHEVLLAAGLDLEQIGQACDRLGVLCQRCDARQMSILRRERVFDPFLESCGLITQSDAERLCKSLLCGRGTPLLTRPLTAEDERIGVRHRCFGKQRGLLLLRLYTTSRQACIACVDCCRLHTPAQFVGHAHQPGEVATCHWGFESANWRRYLLLDSKHRLGSHERERMQAALDAVKGRFLDEDGNRPMECSDSAVTADCSGPRNSASEPMDWQQQPQPQQPHFLSSSEESHGKHYSRCRLAEPKKWSPQQLQQQQQRRRRQQRKQITAEIRRMHRPPVQHQPAQNRRHLRPPVDEFVGADFAPNQRLRVQRLLLLLVCHEWWRLLL